MGVSLNPNNGPEKDEGLTCLSDSLSQLSLLKPEFAGIEKSFAQISLVSKEEEEEGKVKDVEEKEEERGQDIDEELKTERRTNEEEKEKKHEVVKEDEKIAKGDEEEKREEKEEEEEENEDKIEKKETEVCLDDLNKRKKDLKEIERVLNTDDEKRKEEKELHKVTSIPKDEDKDIDKLDAKVKTEKIEKKEDDKHSSGEEEEEKQNRKASGKAPKYRSRGIDDIRSDLYNIIENHSPSHSYTLDHSLAPYFIQPTQPQFHHSPQYGQSPSYSAMSPLYQGMGGVNDQTSFMTERGWLPLSPALSSTDDNDSNLSCNDLSSGMASNYSQVNDQYNQPLQIGDQYQYGQCFPQQIQSGAEFSQLVSSYSPTQSLVPDYYVQLPQEESLSPQMFDSSCSSQQQPNLLSLDQASPQPTEVLPLQSTEYSEDLDFACKLLKNEVENPSRTQFSEAEVAPIKEDLIASIKKPANYMHSATTQPTNYIHPATIQPVQLPDYTWDMKCNEALFMKQFKVTAKWSNNYVTESDPDGDTPSMVIAMKPAKVAGYTEKLRAVVERQKGVDMCCSQIVPQDQGDIPVCQLCHNSNSLNFHSSLGIRNKQGDTILSSVVRMGYPASVIHFVLDNLRPADLPRVFTSVDAQFYAGYVQYYPELQKYQ